MKKAGRVLHRHGLGLVATVLAAVVAGGCSGRFTNLDGTGAPDSIIPAFRLLFVDGGVADLWTGAFDKVPVPRVEPDLALIAAPPRSGEGARLTWIGHASWLVQIEGKSILIDPVFGEFSWGPGERNVPAGIPPDKLPPIDAVLITHNHYDHLDLPSVKRIGAPVVAGLGMRAFFAVEGISAAELNWWQSVDLGPVKVTFAPGTALQSPGSLRCQRHAVGRVHRRGWIRADLPRGRHGVLRGLLGNRTPLSGAGRRAPAHRRV